MRWKRRLNPSLPWVSQDRVLLPPPGNQPAVIIPLDYAEIVPASKSREPYSAIKTLFEKSEPQISDLLAVLSPFLDPQGVTGQKVDEVSPFWNNGYFGPMDAKFLYAMARNFQPKHVIEIGSGNSTKFLRKAITDGNLATQITSIDPNPRASISSIVDSVIAASLTDCPLSTFESVQAGDFLFLDASHLVLHGTDVPFFFLRVLPMMPKGVIVHVHDIYLPEEYPEACDYVFYSEQYVLAALLLGGGNWRTLIPAHWAFTKAMVAGDGASFWMIRE